MSDRPDHNIGQEHEQPLFQNMDEKERSYAPQQVPGALSTADSDDPDRQSAVPPAVTTNITTPELTMAAPASIAAHKAAAGADDNQEET